MGKGNTFNLSTKAAEGYEAQKVPAIFEPLGKATIAHTDLPENARILDVACGTGIISRLLSQSLAGRGHIVGADLNAAMVEIAKKLMPDTHHTVEWKECDVAELPFDSDFFDLAFCQQGLQFFPEKSKALTEIRRVIAPAGHLLLTCWSSVSPVFQAVSDSLRRHVSEGAANQAVGPYAFRDEDTITTLLTEVGFKDVSASKLTIDRHFKPSRDAIRAEILSSPYEQEVSAKGISTLGKIVAEVDSALEQYRVGDELIVPQDTHLFRATK